MIVTLKWSQLSEKRIWIAKSPSPPLSIPIQAGSRQFLGDISYAQYPWPSSRRWPCFRMFAQPLPHCKNCVHPFLTLKTMSAKHFHTSNFPRNSLLPLHVITANDFIYKPTTARVSLCQDGVGPVPNLLLWSNELFVLLPPNNVIFICVSQGPAARQGQCNAPKISTERKAEIVGFRGEQSRQSTAHTWQHFTKTVLLKERDGGQDSRFGWSMTGSNWQSWKMLISTQTALL